MSKLEIRTNGDVYQTIEFEGNVTAFVSTRAGGGQFVIDQDTLAYIDLRNVRQVGPVVAGPDWASNPVVLSASFRISPNEVRTIDVNAEVTGGVATDSRIWDFGDGTTTDDQSNAEHTYEADGEYTLGFSFAGLASSQPISFPIPAGVPVDTWLPFGYLWPDDGEPEPDPETEPTQAWTKVRILSWLSQKGIQLSGDAENQFTKEELLDIVKNFLDDEKDPVGMVLAAKAKSDKAQAVKDAKADDKASAKK